MQSVNYVPGISGMRIDFQSGAIEINGGSAAGGGLPSEPQMINVTAGQWSECDLPSNAIEYYKFIGEQVMRIPIEHRDSAEFSTEDISFDRDGSDVRTRLTYQRLETAEEAKARASLPADSVVISERGDATITSRGRVVVRLGCWNDDEQPAEQPFAVEGDQVFINQALIDPAMWSLKMSLNSQGQYVAAGIGYGIDLTQGEAKDGQRKIDRAIEKGDATEILSLIADQIARADLGQDLRDAIAKIANPTETIRQVIRDEFKPGGLLHRR